MVLFMYCLRGIVVLMSSEGIYKKNIFQLDNSNRVEVFYILVQNTFLWFTI